MTVSPSRLTPLLAPRSVAVIGASARAGRPGNQVLEALRQADPTLHVYPITPRYDEIAGLECAPDIASAPEVDLAIIASGAERIESDLEAAIEAGVRAALIFGAPYDGRPAWLTRVAACARDAGIALLGPDSLGYVNFTARVAATWAKPHVSEGGIALISQSGTVYWEANTNDPRVAFSLTAHTGLEATVTIAELIEYAVELETTRVIGIYIETVRDADAFAQALAAASARDLPVVALSAGRTARSKVQMTTHAGRLAGDGAALEGLFRAHGVARTVTPDEWWATITLLGAERRFAEGGLAAVMDSGGGLAMFLDYADELRIPVARFGERTSQALAELLGTDVVPDGAIDFWVGEADRHGSTEDLLCTVADDPNTAAVFAFTTYGESASAGFAAHTALACEAAVSRTEKPIAAATYTSRQIHSELLTRLSRSGIPTLDGMLNALVAARHAFDRRDYRRFAAGDTTRCEPAATFGLETVAGWCRRLAGAGTLVEAPALEFLADFGVPTVKVYRAADEDAAANSASSLGFPVVLKTDEGITHKVKQGGVHLGLRDEAAVRAAYRELAAGLGPRVLIAPMVCGVEIALGIVAGQFGMTLMVSAGGGLIELLTDRCYLLGPASPREVELAMADLRVTRVLNAALGAGSRQIDAFYEFAARVSALGAEFAGTITELDINPVIVGEDCCVAVDALVRTTTDGGGNDGI